jgi:hypothetical protein
MNVPRQDNPTANRRREFSSKQLDPDRSAQLTAYFLLASSAGKQFRYGSGAESGE